MKSFRLRDYVFDKQWNKNWQGGQPAERAGCNGGRLQRPARTECRALPGLFVMCKVPIKPGFSASQSRLFAPHSRLFTSDARFFTPDTRYFVADARYSATKYLASAPENLSKMANLTIFDPFSTANPVFSRFLRNYAVNKLSG
jgi:hypothetical protein